MNKLIEIRRPIEAEMQAYRTLFEETLQTDNPLLNIALQHVLKRQGKAMRPILVMLAARYVGEVNEHVLHAAVALELLHTASLVHDDVVDESDRRRGQKSVNALLDNKAAVLVGDFLLSKALYHSAQTGSQRVVTWVAELGHTLSDGELLQLVNIDKKEISEEDYFEVIRKKTASLFETCARVGALLAGGEDDDVEMLGNFGLQVGVCFQLRDDLLDYDNQHDTGKPSGNDMKEGKLTLPVVNAILSTNDEAMKDLALKVRSGDATDDEICRLVDFTKTEGGTDYVEKILDKIGRDSINLLQGKGDRNEEVVNSLIEYVRFVIDREI